ncbi:MAG: type II toxin-antitoxin system prevent-host-death family antitoxin [Alphaproteobacteria bacterium]|nr:type II toxin-antitoxin system prevent-host-death family antitoxin [Alphaproteobacteria bacterium]
MSKTISLRDANQRFSRCIREVEAGEDFVITRNGRPVARLAPMGPSRRLTAEQEAARERALEIMREGQLLGTERFNRNEIYEERIDRFGKR